MFDGRTAKPYRELAEAHAGVVNAIAFNQQHEWELMSAGALPPPPSPPPSPPAPPFLFLLTFLLLHIG